jgi:glycosyltransferase involved in cell wall biosynthesis
VRILFLDQFSDLGGAQRCLLDLLPAIREQGWHAHVVAPGDGRLFEEARALGATTETISLSRNPLRYMRDALHLALRIGKEQADLIYANGPRTLPAAAAAKAPVLFHCHSRLTQSYAVWLARQSIRHTGATVVGSCRYVLKPFPDPVHVVYNGVAPSTLARKRNAHPRIGVIGRIAPEKGQLEFIKAAGLIGCDCQFVICGAPLFCPTGYLDSLRRLADKLPVEFLGWRDDVYAVLAEMDLLVVPSAAVEATTRVILEAYAAGVPVLARLAGGIPEIVRHGETGFLVDSTEPKVLASAIRDALQRPTAELDRIAGNAREAWRQNFTLQRYRRQMMEMICRAASGKKVRPRVP